jgi:transposase
MDTSRQVPDVIVAKSESFGAPKRQRRIIAEKRRIVEETLVEGASVARAHGVNANQVFYWRKLYQTGRLGVSGAAPLLPVRIWRESSPPATISLVEHRSTPPSSSGAIHIELRHAQVHIEGSAIRHCCACCWSAWGNDRIAGQHADLDCGGSDGLATGLHRAERAGREQAGAEAFSGHVFVFRGRGDLIKVLWYDGDGLSLFRSGWSVAAGGKQHGFADASPAVDVAGRHRLAATGVNVGAAVVGVDAVLDVHRFLCRAVFRACG